MATLYEKSSGPAAYGSSGSTGHFDPIVYLKKPQVILRLASWLFGIVVWGCISSQGWEFDHCLFNDDAGACNYGTAIGIMAFILTMMFLILDAVFDVMSNVQNRKFTVIADIASSGVMSFLWFVCFCYLANSWRITERTPKVIPNQSGLEAAVAFAFFSTGSFIALTVLAVLRYREGINMSDVGFNQDSFAQPSDASPF